MDSSKTVDVYLDPDNFDEGALRLVRHVRPNWTGDIARKIFSNGITNKMLGYYQHGNESDMVLVRINGNSTEIFLDRANEIQSFLKLHAAGCAPRLYCTFNNGLCYEYIPGNTVSRDEVRIPEVFNLIIKEMVKLHKIPIAESSQKEPVCFSLCKRFIDLRFSKDAPPGRGLENYDGPTEKDLWNELEVLKQHLSKLSSPLVYCHNDLLLNNIIVNKEKGVDDMDYSYYPERPLQLAWLREYLKHWKNEQHVNDTEVEDLYIKAAHFLWATWALVQAKYSAIDFDYLTYAKDRLNEYFKRKEKFLSL